MALTHWPVEVWFNAGNSATRFWSDWLPEPFTGVADSTQLPLVSLVEYATWKARLRQNRSFTTSGSERVRHRPLRREVATIRTRYRGAPVAYTEPVPGYLVAAAGLRNLAPDSFTRPIEEGAELSPSAVAAMNTLVAQRRIRALLYNSQAVSPITAQLRTAAQQAGIPVVPVTETLPPGVTFQQWQLRQARALAAALSK